MASETVSNNSVYGTMKERSIKPKTIVKDVQRERRDDP